MYLEYMDLSFCLSFPFVSMDETVVNITSLCINRYVINVFIYFEPNIYTYTYYFIIIIYFITNLQFHYLKIHM